MIRNTCAGSTIQLCITFFYGGHSIKSLYVRQKYASFKEEILRRIDIKKYDDCVLKAQTYVKATTARQICAADEDNDMHYDIKEGTSLSL